MIEAWYDMKCNICGRWLSSDFATGLDRNKNIIIKWAKEQGWTVRDSKHTYCPHCIEVNKNQIVK